MPDTMVANRSYLPAPNSRLTLAKEWRPGKAQNRSMGPRTSSRPWTVSLRLSTGRCCAPARASWVAASSRLHQESFLTCHRLLYAFATVTHLRCAVNRLPTSHDAPGGRL